jgi:hypothetical protein
MAFNLATRTIKTEEKAWQLGRYRRIGYVDDTNLVAGDPSAVLSDVALAKLEALAKEDGGVPSSHT